MLSGAKRYGHKGNVTPENSDAQFWTADRNQPARVAMEYVRGTAGYTAQSVT